MRDDGAAVVRSLAKVLQRLIDINRDEQNQQPCIRNDEMKHQGDVSGANLITKFQSLYVPSVSILAYLERIHRYSGCSESCYVVALIYIDRLIEARNMKITELNAHRIVITSVLLAAKFLDDFYYNNAYYAQLGGVTTSEMNALELEFLNLIGFSLNVSSEVFSTYAGELSRFFDPLDSVDFALLHCAPSHAATAVTVNMVANTQTPAVAVKVASVALTVGGGGGGACLSVDGYTYGPIPLRQLCESKGSTNTLYAVDLGHVAINSKPTDVFSVSSQYIKESYPHESALHATLAPGRVQLHPHQSFKTVTPVPHLPKAQGGSDYDYESEVDSLRTNIRGFFSAGSGLLSQPQPRAPVPFSFHDEVHTDTLYIDDSDICSWVASVTPELARQPYKNSSTHELQQQGGAWMSLAYSHALVNEPSGVRSADLQSLLGFYSQNQNQCYRDQMLPYDQLVPLQQHMEKPEQYCPLPHSAQIHFMVSNESSISRSSVEVQSKLLPVVCIN